MTNKRQSPGLIDEPPMMIYKTMATELGINKAIVFQQLHYLLNQTEQMQTKYNQVDGFWWVYNSYNQWHENYFPWLSVSALKKIFTELEKDGFVISRQGVKSPTDRRKWYRIDYEAWENRHTLIGQKMSHQDETKNVPCNVQPMSDVYTKTPTKTTEKDISDADAPGSDLASPDEVPAVETTPSKMGVTCKDYEVSKADKGTRKAWKETIARLFFRYGQIPDGAVQWWRIGEWCNLLRDNFPDTTVADLGLFATWYGEKTNGCQLHQTRLFHTEYTEFRDTDMFKLSRMSPEKRENAQLALMLGHKI